MFYLSNSSMALFPENTLSDYTTKLPRDFALVGSWEVALSEIMYPSTWNNIADGREYYVKVGVPNKADLKIHLKTDYYKYPEDILFQLARSLDRKLKKRPPPYILSYSEHSRKATLNITVSVVYNRFSEKLRRLLGFETGYFNKPGLFTAGYLETFIKVCTPSTFTATCWSIALSAIHLLLYFPSYQWKDNTVMLFIDDTKICITSQFTTKPLTTFILH